MKLFFSYGHDNHSEVVYRLAKKIESLDKKMDVWIDTDKIPRDSHWRNKITTGIIGSNSVIAFLSSYSAREESVCRDELSIALCSKHGMIKTILLEPANSFTPPSIVTEYQWGDMSNYPDYLDQGEEAFDQYIEAEAKKIIQLVKSDEIQKYDREIRELRELLGLPETDVLTRFDKLLGSEIVGRTWLFEKIKAWAEDTEGSQIMMLYGKPGAGKSMFAAHLQMYEPHVIAAFPCDCRSSEFSRTDSIIRNIAYRLALRMPDYRSVLLNILRKRPNYNDENMMFNLLIATPLAKYNIDGGRETQIIIVDALDEMKNDHLAQFIDQYAPMMKRYVRFLITSRKIPEITERFNNYSSIDIDAYTSAGKADLKAYYEKRLGEALAEYPEKDAFIQKLIEASELMFAYARCVCDNILADIAEGRFRIHEYPIPKGLNKLYMATLDRYFNSSDAPYTFQDYEDNWQEALGMIAASPEPMPISTLMKLMGWGKNALKRFCRPLSALLVKTGETLQLFHRSFIEWLNTTDCGYASSVEDGIGNLADRCYAVYEEDAEELDAYMLLYTTKFCREAKRKKQYKALKDDDSYVMRVIEHADHLRKMEHAYSHAMKFYGELLRVFDKVDVLTSAGKQANTYGIITDRIGACYEAANNFHMAMQYYRKDLEISKQLKDSYPENLGYLRNYSISLEKIAGIYEATKLLDSALEYYQKVLEISEKLKDICPKNPNCLLGYSISLNRVAGIYEALNQLDSALERCHKAFEIKKQLKDVYPENLEYFHSYSIALERIAGIYKAMNRLDDALECYQKTLEIPKQIKDSYLKNSDYLRDYSVILNKIAEVYEATNQLDNAFEYYWKGLKIFEQLKDNYPEASGYLCDYSISLESIAGIYEAMNQLDNAFEYYQKCLKIRNQLKDAYPKNPDYLYYYSVPLERIAGIYEAMNQLNVAFKCYQKCLKIRNQLKDAYPKNPDYLFYYSISLEHIAGIYEAMNQLDNAFEYYQKCLKIRNQLKDAYPKNPDYLFYYSISLERIARIYETMNQLNVAFKCYQECLKIRSGLKDTYPKNPDYLRNYSVSLEILARIYESMSQLDITFKYCQEGMENFRRLKDAYPEDINYLYDYYMSLNQVAKTCVKMNKLDNALRFYQESLEIEKLLQDHNT
ncbi:TIR domain-containing protein [Ruminococcus sp.]